MSITKEQLELIKSKVNQLVHDKEDADIKTQVSNDADVEALHANAIAAQAKLDESNADALATADLKDLTVFLESLSPPVVPTPS